MTANIESLIRSLGKSYQDIIDAGLIPYKTMPKGAPGSPKLSLDMAKEGVFLTFHRNSKIFKEITLRIQDDKKKNWEFPNQLPLPLQKKMSREWIHTSFGQPDRSIPPKIVGQMTLGWAERYSLDDFHIPLTMQIRYDMNEMVEKITFFPTSELRW